MPRLEGRVKVREIQGGVEPRVAKAHRRHRCREIVDLLADYLDGSLDAATTRGLRAHLEGCAPCIAFVKTYAGTVKAARRLKETDLPPELKDRLLSFLRERNVP